ncbi:MAG: hypothetical protein A2Y40_08700 [Candidatus Margulisbacteria bacterium GWF2_35_9]|nr:MAG: hypothetical protein A2Y40_08700 [Candidatus Margulisbacteria bacterium GWF2_35_9]
MKNNKSLIALEHSINSIIRDYNINSDDSQNLVTQFNECKNILIRQNQILIDQEKMVMIGDLAASVAHEINTPLLAAIMSTNKLKDSTNDGPMFEKYFSMLESALTRIKQQSINLKALVKYQDSIAVFNLVNELESDLSLLGFMLLDIEVQKDYSPETQLLINGNSGQINQVIVNIIKNAVESIPEGRDGKIIIATYEENNKIILKITDNGSGISNEHVNRLFKENFTTKTRGTGIGLKLCKDIIDRHEGTIRIDSSEGIGSTFTIELNKFIGD